MARIGLFFSSSSGNTRGIAKAIRKRFPGDDLADPLNINKATPELFAGYGHLILGTCTLGDGELPGADNDCPNGGWAEFLPRIAGLDLGGRTVALYGLGDQIKYGENFVDAMGLLHDFLVTRGARTVGAWPTDGYEFLASKAEADGHFVGLALDQDNQKTLTGDRLETWLRLIAAEFRLRP